jgi:nucleotide-binding universal stress UspA family protein
LSVNDTYRSLLVPLDGSVHAAAALERAIEIAKRSRAWVTLLHVIEPPRLPPVGAAYVVGLLSSESEEQAEALLERAAAQVPEGIPRAPPVRGQAATEFVASVLSSPPALFNPTAGVRAV